MGRILGILLIACWAMFGSSGIVHAANTDISDEYPFNIETVDMADGTVFTYTLSASGTFYIDWGDGTEPETITRTNTTNKTYTHEYTTGGRYVIKFGGRATGYSTGNQTPAISFDSNLNIEKIYGRIGKIFSTIAPDTKAGNQPRFINLFHLCTGLRGEIPDNMFDGVYGQPVSYMFRSLFDMSTIEEATLTGPIPENLFAGLSGEPAEYMFRSTFYGGLGFTGNIPPNLFAGIAGPAKSGVFENTFYNCSGLTGSIPDGFFAEITGAPASTMFSNTFYNCSGLTGKIPANLFAGISGAPASTMFSGTFYNCTGLTGSIPDNLFGDISGVPAQSMFNSTFYNCTGLTGIIPEQLFSGIVGDAQANMFSSTFFGCSGLTGYVPFESFSGITGFGTTTVDGFSNMVKNANALSPVCPLGTNAYTKPSNWGIGAVCGGCTLNQYKQDGACMDCPAGYTHAKTVGSTINDCEIVCQGGSYLPTAYADTCVDVGAGYYAAPSRIKYGESGTRYKCPDTETTIGYGTGADDITDCGRVMHIGDNEKIYLRNTKMTSPALAVQIQDHVNYADMAPGWYGKLRTIVNGTVYSIYDDTMRYTFTGLPSGYTRLSYIESNNWAYINTGITVGPDIDFYYVAQFPTVSSDQKTAVYWMEQGNGLQYYASAFVADPTHIRAYRNNRGSPSLYTVIARPQQPIEWQTRGDKFYINGEEYRFPNQESAEFGNYQIFVLGKNKTGKMDTADSSFILNGIRLYRWKLERNGVLIQDLVPARRDEDGEIGMFDLLTNKFFTNQYSAGYFSGE